MEKDKSTYVTGLECLNCGSTFKDKPYFKGCPKCRTEDFVSNVVPKYDFDAISEIINPKILSKRKGGVWKFQELLPVDSKYSVSIGEGNTPLISCDKLSKRWDLESLYLKDESQNPTWSFKDRLISVAVSKARELGARVVTTASTGNHGASTAAYAANAGLNSVIFTLPEVPKTMKTLMQIYGASVVAIPNFKDRWNLMEECINEFDWYPTSNYILPPVGSNHYGIEGYKTIAYEIIEFLNWRSPDWIVQPTALADGLSGIWRGFKDFKRLGIIDKLPKMVSVEPFGPLKNAFDKGLDHLEQIETDDTIAFSINENISTYQGLHTLNESEGVAVLCEDSELIEIQKTLGKTTGMYSEAASLASIAGVRSLREEDVIKSDETVVAINTSSGLKDPEMTSKHQPDVPTIKPSLKEFKKILEMNYGVSI